MIMQPEPMGISVNGTTLSEEETAALLTVITTQLIDVPAAEPPVDHSTRNRVTSTWAVLDSWQQVPRGY